MSKVLTTKQQILRRVLLYGVLLVFAAAVLPATCRSRQPDAYSASSYWRTVRMESLRHVCESYAEEHGQYPFSPEGSDEALRLVTRRRFVGRASPETVDAWLGREVDFVYLNDPDVGRLPPDTIILVTKYPIHPDGRLHVAPRLGAGAIGMHIYLIDSGGLSPAEVLGRRLSEFSVSTAFQPEVDPYDISVHMESLRMACESYADIHHGQYAFSPQGSDEALRLVAGRMCGRGEAPSVLVDMQLQYRSTSAPGEVDYLYLNDPDAGRLPLGTIMLVEKSPIRPDGKLHVAPRVAWEPTGRHVYLIDSGGLTPAEVLGRRLSEFPVSPAP